MVEETVPRRLSQRRFLLQNRFPPLPGRALLAGLAIAGLAGAFAWHAPERNGWAALALALALGLDGLAQGAGAGLRRRGRGEPRIPGLPSLVLALAPGSGLAAILFALALLIAPSGFPLAASALAGLIAMGAIARLVLTWIVLRAGEDPEA